MDWSEYETLIQQARRGENILTKEEQQSFDRKRRQLVKTELAMDAAIRSMHRREYMREWNNRNPGKNREYRERFERNHPGRRAEQSREYRKRHPDRCAKSRRKWVESMSVEEKKEYERKRWQQVKNDPERHERQLEYMRNYRARKKAERKEKHEC